MHKAFQRKFFFYFFDINKQSKVSIAILDVLEIMYSLTHYSQKNQLTKYRRSYSVRNFLCLDKRLKFQWYFERIIVYKLVKISLGLNKRPEVVISHFIISKHYIHLFGVIFMKCSPNHQSPKIDYTDCWATIVPEIF